MYLFVHFNVHFEKLKSVKSTKNYKFLIGGPSREPAFKPRTRSHDAQINLVTKFCDERRR